MFNFDWFHHGGLTRLIEEAKTRCARRKYPPTDDAAAAAAARKARPQPHKKNNDTEPGRDPAREKYEAFRSALAIRIILYMKDGLTYEMKEMVDIGMSSALTFECTPVDENYKVGAIVLIVPFEDIARVEVFAVHPDDRPQENLRIGGFRSAAAESGRE
jgi:hypothetical protein